LLVATQPSRGCVVTNPRPVGRWPWRRFGGWLRQSAFSVSSGDSSPR